MPNPKTPDKICEAAIRVASRDGLNSMTLDNVAKEAGVSKGGVMYHFHSKDELVGAVMTYFGQQVEQMLMRKVSCDPNPQCRWARAMISSAFPDGDNAAQPETPFPDGVLERFLLATLAGAVSNPEMMAPLREFGTQLQQRLLADSSDGLEQLLVWLMVDGLFLWQFIGLIKRDDPLYARICGELRAKVSTAPPTCEAPAPANEAPVAEEDAPLKEKRKGKDKRKGKGKGKRKEGRE